MKARDIVLTVWALCDGDWQRTFDYIRNKRPMSEELIEETLAGLDKDDYITIVDEDYPENLKKVSKPPFVIAR